jgi:hypothetical protein
MTQLVKHDCGEKTRHQVDEGEVHNLIAEKH